MKLSDSLDTLVHAFTDSGRRREARALALDASSDVAGWLKLGREGAEQSLLRKGFQEGYARGLERAATICEQKGEFPGFIRQELLALPAEPKWRADSARLGVTEAEVERDLAPKETT